MMTCSFDMHTPNNNCVVNEVLHEHFFDFGSYVPNIMMFSIVLHREGHGLAKSPSVKCRYGEGSCYMFDMKQVLILPRCLSMTVCIAWLKMAGETGKSRAPVSV